MQELVFLLKTYIGDIDYVARLLKSYRRYNADKIPLYIVIPKSDFPFFRKFKDKGIRLLSDESITNDFVKDDSVFGIRPGYMNQEIVKLAFWEKNFCENYFCIDSDGVFIRKFYKSDFMYSKHIPYTILSEDNELKVDPEYYKKYWRSREKLIRKIQDKVGVEDKRMLTCHGFAILSSKVMKSFYKKFMLPKGYTYKDVLKISPYEFSWYSMWLQKNRTIPIKKKEPLMKIFHQKSQHIEYLNNGVSINDMARGYIGYVLNSNYSRMHGVVDYDQSDKYALSLEEIKHTFYNVYLLLGRINKKIKNFLKNK